MIRSTLLALLVAVTIGCASKGTQFEVTVNNQTKDILTLWLTKDGAPEEDAWLSPEQLTQRMVKDQNVSYDAAKCEASKSEQLQHEIADHDQIDRPRD